MTTTWNLILAGAVTLASAAGVVGGEAAKGELRLVEAATSISSAGSGASRAGPPALTRVAGDGLGVGLAR